MIEELPDIDAVKRLRLEPSDYLILEVTQDITPGQAEQLKAYITDYIDHPPERILVVSGGLTISTRG